MPRRRVNGGDATIDRVRILFLDDDPERHRHFHGFLEGAAVEIVAVTTAEEAIAAIDASPFDLICLDHDLNGQIFVESGPGTGYEVALHLARTPRAGAQIVVHSLNEDGARKMLEVLGPTAVWIPFFNLRAITDAIKASR